MAFGLHDISLVLIRAEKKGKAIAYVAFTLPPEIVGTSAVATAPTKSIAMGYSPLNVTKEG